MEELLGDKGINELIKGFNKLLKIKTNCKLILVGPFEENLDPIKDITRKEIYLNKNIINVGYKKDVRPFFAISNILTFLSYREGFPNVVMQACAMSISSIVLILMDVMK